MKNFYKNYHYDYQKEVVDFGKMSAEDKNDYIFFRDNILSKSQNDLHKYLLSFLKKYYKGKKIHNSKDNYIFVEGKDKILLLAHLDTVHSVVPTIDTICVSENGTIMSPYGVGGDDRCGVYIILKLIMKGYRPSVLFTHDEEIGGVGASAFADSKFIDNKAFKSIKYMCEFDRKGADECVFYDNDNREFIDYITSFGLVEDFGSFSDISIIGPETGVASVNVSSAYWEAHQSNTYINMVRLNQIVGIASKMIDDLPNIKQYSHVEVDIRGCNNYFNKYAYYDNDMDDVEKDYYSDEANFSIYDVDDDDLLINSKNNMRYDPNNSNQYRCLNDDCKESGEPFYGFELDIDDNGELRCPVCGGKVALEVCYDECLYSYHARKEGN